ncbi:MAG: STAS domain-containing protein [Actinomycetota bacterium]
MNGLARIEVEETPGLCLLRIKGEIDMSNAQELSAEIEAAVPNGAPTLVVDLTETTYLDSAGVKLLFLLADRYRARRRVLRLIVPPEAPIRAVLELTGLSRVVSLEDRLDSGPES